MNSRPPRPICDPGAYSGMAMDTAWMDEEVGAYAYDLTGSSTYVGVLTFAQLGPLLLLSILGGVVADMVDRRRWLISTHVHQLVFAAVLALLVTVEPARATLLRSSNSAPADAARSAFPWR